MYKYVYVNLYSHSLSDAGGVRDGGEEGVWEREGKGVQTHNAQMKHFDAAGVDSVNKSSSNNNKEGEEEHQKKKRKSQ